MLGKSNVEQFCHFYRLIPTHDHTHTHARARTHAHTHAHQRARARTRERKRARTRIHTPKDAQRSPRDPAYTTMCETRVRGPFFQGFFFPETFSPGVHPTKPREF